MHLKKIKNKFSFKRGANRKNRKIIIMAILFIILLSLVYFLKVARHFPKKINLNHKADFFGVTFSTKYSKEIGLDWKEVFLATVDDLKVRQIRLPIYWDEVESVEGVYDFSKYDYIILEGEKRGVNFIVNVGLRLPRWPECHSPKWADDKSIEYKQAKVIEMITTTVDRYKDRSSIVVWQLENEPFFNQFGVCPPADEEFFNEELATLRSLDDRPVLITATGELSFWKKEAKLADIFGSTLYRVVWSKWLGFTRYPIPASFYRLKANWVGIEKEKIIISELQAEPWVPNGNIIYQSEKEAAKSFNIDQFEANLQFAINTKFDKAYLWGLEWWYYKYKNGDPVYWELAKTLF